MVCLCIILQSFGLWRGGERSARGSRKRERIIKVKWGKQRRHDRRRERKENNEGGRDRWWNEKKRKLFQCSFSHNVCWCTCVAGMSVQDMCVSHSAHRQLWINHVLLMASEMDETHYCYCLPNENSRGGGGITLQLCLCLSSSWDDFVPLETKVCEKRRQDGCCEDEWVGSHQARIRRGQRRL